MKLLIITTPLTNNGTTWVPLAAPTGGGNAKYVVAIGPGTLFQDYGDGKIMISGTGASIASPLAFAMAWNDFLAKLHGGASTIEV